MQKIIFPNASIQDQCCYENLLHALITYGDEVWIQLHSYNIKKKDGFGNSYYVINELIEEGLVKLWDFEQTIKHNTKDNLNIISNDEYKIFHSYVDEMVYDKTILESIPIESRTTKIIELKQGYMNIAIANSFNLDAIMYSKSLNNNKNSILLNSNTFNENISKYSNKLFEKVNVTSLSGLSTKNIIELRKYSKFIRKAIDDCINKKMIKDFIPNNMIDNDCNNLLKEYYSNISEIIEANHSLKKLITGISVDIISMFCSFLALPIIGKKLIDYNKGRNSKGLALYLTKLKRYS